MVPPDLDGRATNRPLKQIPDPLLKNLIGGQPDRILEAFGLQELVGLRVREGGIGTEVAALELPPIAGHDRLNLVLPTVRRMDVARTQHAAFQITELIEHEQRVIAGASEVPVVGRALLISVARWLILESIVENNCPRRLAAMNAVDLPTGEIGKRGKVLLACQPLRLEPAHLAG